MVADVTVPCGQCKNKVSVPEGTQVASCPHCGATIRWLRCTHCRKVVGVAAHRRDGAWTFNCPKCGWKQTQSVGDGRTAETVPGRREQRLDRTMGLSVLLGFLPYLIGLGLYVYGLSAFGPNPIMATGTTPASTSCQYEYVYEPPWQGFDISYSGGWYREPVGCTTTGGSTYQYVEGYTKASPLLGSFMTLGYDVSFLSIPLFAIGFGLMGRHLKGGAVVFGLMGLGLGIACAFGGHWIFASMLTTH